MAVDPVEYIDGGQQYFQRYSYADNNPYKYTDPTGEWLVRALYSVSAFAAGLIAKDFHDSAEEGYEQRDKAIAVQDKQNDLISSGDLTQAFGSGLAKQINDEQSKILPKAMDATEAAGGTYGSYSGGQLPRTLKELAESQITSAIEPHIKNLSNALEDRRKKEVESSVKPDESAKDKSGNNSNRNRGENNDPK